MTDLNFGKKNPNKTGRQVRFYRVPEEIDDRLANDIFLSFKLYSSHFPEHGLKFFFPSIVNDKLFQGGEQSFLHCAKCQDTLVLT